MRYFKLLFVFIISCGVLVSCDRVTFPKVETDGLDPDLYPGNFQDYEYPTFTENTNTSRNVLIEYFTGHNCLGCPTAADVGKAIESAHPGRVFMTSIHAGPDDAGVGTFQETSDAKPRDFTNPNGIEIARTYKAIGAGMASLPRGNINRVSEDGSFLVSHGSWGDKVDQVLASPLSVNLQAKSTYFSETNGIYLHVESHFLTHLTGNYNLVGYVVEDEVIAPQAKFGAEGETIEDYKHHHVHLGNLFGETWGRSIAAGQVATDTKVQRHFSYVIPEGLTKEDIHFLFLVFDRDSYELLQVIDHRIE